MDHNEKLKLRVGKDYSYSTYEKYCFTYDKVLAFITSQLRVKDLLLRNLDAKFIIDFDQYLRVHDNNKHNTAVKYCLNLKRIINVAVLEGVIPFNPFVRHKTVYKDKQQVYLYEYEVSLLEQAKLHKARHVLVRYLFLFQCYTGLAYTDLSSLTSSELSRTPDGSFWILKKRQKSGILSTIPLLPQALEILKSYAIKEKVQVNQYSLHTVYRSTISTSEK